MKRILALLLALIMILTVATACSDNESTDDENSVSQENADANGEESEDKTNADADADEEDSDNKANADADEDESDNKTNSSHFTFKGKSFSIPGDFEEKVANDDVVAYSNGAFVVSFNYLGETSSDKSQEELTKSIVNSMLKYDSNREIEIFENENTGVFYYTVDDGEYKYATCEYISAGIQWSVITSNLSDDALDTISSIEFAE